MFHDTIRANLRYARPDATEAELWEALAAAQTQDAGREACLTGWTRWSASAATGCPVASGSGWPSPGCCSKHRPIVVLDEATAHLDSESEVAVQRALDMAMVGTYQRRDRPPAVHGP